MTRRNVILNTREFLDNRFIFHFCSTNINSRRLILIYFLFLKAPQLNRFQIHVDSLDHKTRYHINFGDLRTQVFEWSLSCTRKFSLILDTRDKHGGKLSVGLN